MNDHSFDGLGHKFQQWSALVKAYWRSRLNRWMKDALISRWLGSIFLAVMTLSILLCFAVFIAAGVAQAGASANGKPLVALGAWNALCGFFVFFWLIGLANEIIRGDALSLQRLMHLPISPSSVFAFNFLLTWINLPILFFLAASLGMAVGNCVIEGAWGLWRFIPIFSYALMVTALTSHLQGKIIVLISNPKTRKILTTIVPILLSFLGIAFSMSSFFIRRLGQGGDVLFWSGILDVAIPFLWLADIFSGKSILGPWSLIWLPCMWLISLWSLRANYQMTTRYYQNGFDLQVDSRAKNESGAQSLEPGLKAKHSIAPGVLWIEKSFFGLTPAASAIAAITWTLFWRSPQLKLAMLLPLLQPLFLLLVLNQKPWIPSKNVPPSTTVVEPSESQSPNKPSSEPFRDFQLPFGTSVRIGTQYQGFYLLAFTVFSTFLGSSFACNIFGFDRSGFRFWVLSALPRSEILRGRNWMFGAMILAIALVVILASNIIWNYSWLRVLEATIAFLAYLPLYLLLSNVISILAPFPMAAHGFQPKEFTWKSVVLNIALSLLIPVIMGLCAIPWAIESGLHWGLPSSEKLPVALLLMPVMVGCSWWLYEQSLQIVGDLMQSREKNLLQVVTSQVEK
jgi:hypothetical protein